VARGFFPLDEQLGIVGSEFSPWLMETVVLLGTLIPFEQVPGVVERVAGVHVGRETVRVLTEAAGAALVEVEAAEREQLERELPAAPEGPALQQVSVDGAMVPLIGGQWVEAKTLAVGEIEVGGGEIHARRLSYVSRVCPAEEFIPALYPELHRRGTERAGTVCLVTDGAEWLQRVANAYRPDAVRILDFAHAAEHVAAACHAVWGFGTAEVSEWLAMQFHELRHGDPEKVLAALRDLPVGTAPDPVAARQAQAQELAYLEKRRDQIAYATFQAAGYPIGSGAVESANKLVVEARLKGAGMHWAPCNVNPLLALRAMKASGRWDERWPVIQLRLAQRRREQRHCRWAARRPREEPIAAPAPPVAATTPISISPAARAARTSKGLMQNGSPAPNHPWRRPISRPSAPKS
jgi:hypothetical protein